MKTWDLQRIRFETSVGNLLLGTVNLVFKMLARSRQEVNKEGIVKEDEDIKAKLKLVK